MPGSGGLMQLIAYGAQDVYLIQPPCYGICCKSLENNWFERIKSDCQFKNYKKHYREKCEKGFMEELEKYMYQDIIKLIVCILVNK